MSLTGRRGRDRQTWPRTEPMAAPADRHCSGASPACRSARPRPEVQRRALGRGPSRGGCSSRRIASPRRRSLPGATESSAPRRSRAIRETTAHSARAPRPVCRTFPAPGLPRFPSRLSSHSSSGGRGGRHSMEASRVWPQGSGAFERVGLSVEHESWRHPLFVRCLELCRTRRLHASPKSGDSLRGSTLCRRGSIPAVSEPLSRRSPSCFRPSGGKVALGGDSEVRCRRST